MASPFQCPHNIAADSYCNACVQADKLRITAEVTAVLSGLPSYTPPSAPKPQSALWRDIALSHELSRKELTQVQAERDVARSLLESSEQENDRLRAERKATALSSLLAQAEADRRILYLESVMADIADVLDPIKHPYLAAKINTILYPQP